MALVEYCRKCSVRHGRRTRIRFLSMRVAANDFIEAAARAGNILERSERVKQGHIDSGSLNKRQAARILYELRRMKILGEKIPSS